MADPNKKITIWSISIFRRKLCLLNIYFIYKQIHQFSLFSRCQFYFPFYFSILNQLYFFTVEFGLCKQLDGSFKVYGAGLLSSVAELNHAISAKDKIKKFDPDITCDEECIITSYQNAYYYTDSFDEAKEKMRAYAETIKRPFMVRYNPYTQTVEVLSNAKKITAVMSELRGDLSIVSSALKKISALDETLDVETLSNLLYQGLQVS